MSVDHGRVPRFGVNLSPAVTDLQETLTVARAADHEGLALVAVQDHPYQPAHLEAWTLLTTLGLTTERVMLTGGVLDLQLRPAGVLAKSIASLSVLTGGRIVAGVGGGAFSDGIAAMSGRRRTPSEMVDYMAAALPQLRRALDGGPVPTEETGAKGSTWNAGPRPASRIELWLGANRPRMLDLVGRHADAWFAPLNINVPPNVIPPRQDAIDRSALRAGRHPADIARVYNVLGTIGRTRGGPGLVGSVADWVDVLTGWVIELGLDSFILWPTTEPVRQTTTFAAEVAPAVLAAVAEARR